MDTPEFRGLPEFSYCPTCGYDLCGQVGDVVICSECGGTHDRLTLQDPVASGERVRALKRDVALVSLLARCMALALFAGLVASKWQICLLSAIQFLMIGGFFLTYGVGKSARHLPRRVDRQLVVLCGLLLFVRQFSWFGFPVLVPLVIVNFELFGRWSFSVGMTAFVACAGFALYDALTFGIIEERGGLYQRVLGHLKHRLGDYAERRT